MPRVTELCADLAQRFRFEESKVLGYSRVLREAGLVTTGARGVNAPDATALDAARILIAMMLRSKKEDAADAVGLFGKLEPFNPASIGGVAIVSFERGLEALISYCMTHPFGSDEFRARVAYFDFDVSIIRDSALAGITIDKIAEHEEDGDEEGVKERREFRFAPKSLVALDPGQPVPDEWLEATRFYRSGFHEVPTLYKQDLIAIGQVLAGHLSVGAEL